MKWSKRYLSFLLCTIMVLSLCLVPFPSKAASYNEEIWFEEGDKLTLEIGESETLTLSGESFDQNSIVWKSGNDNIITVEDGAVEAVGIGRTYITAKVSVDDSEATPSGAKKTVTAKCVVNVENSLMRVATPTVPDNIAANWDYTIYNDEVTITKYKGTDTDVVVPGEIEDKPVTKLGNYLFDGKAIISAVVPDSVEEFGYGIFDGCDKLTNIILSKSLKVLPAYTFRGCSSLETIILPESLEEITSSAFGDTSIEELYIPANVDKITVETYGLPTSIKNYEVSPNSNSFSSIDGMLVSKNKEILYLYPTGRIKDNRKYILKLPDTINEIVNMNTIMINSYDSNINVYLGQNIKKVGELPRSSQYLNIWAESTSEIYKILTINNKSINLATEDEFDQVMASNFNFKYDNADNTLIVLDYIGIDQVMNIPAKFGSLKVTKLDTGIFYNKNISTIIIPETFQSIVRLGGPGMGYEWMLDQCKNIYKIINNSSVDISLDLNYQSYSIGWYDQEFSGGVKLEAIKAKSTAYKHYGIYYGGVHSSENYDMIDNYGYDEEFVLPNPPFKSGYTFNGWYERVGTITSPEKRYLKIIPKGTNDNISIYADYIKNSSSGSSGGSSGSDGGGGGGSGSSSDGGYKVGSTTSSQNTPGNWKQDEKGWWFQKTDGSYPKDEWVMHNNVWYHFDPAGYMQSGWIELNNLKYFLNPDGSMISNNWSQQNGKWYFFGEDGSMKIGWVKWNNKWYYTIPDGTMAVNYTTPDGFQINENGEWIQ